MKALFSILAIISFVTIAVFGFSAMEQDPEHGHSKICIATVANGFECPPGTNLIDFHLNAFRTFSNATLLAYSLLALFVALWTLPTGPFGLKPVLKFQTKDRGPLFISRETILKSWFSLHENSPSAA